MTELLHVALRGVGVLLPGAGVWGFAGLRGGVPDGDFGTFLGAMGLSLLAAVVWSATDARHASTARVVSRWVATAVVDGAGLGIVSTLTAPGTPPGSQRVGEVLWLSAFYGVPLLAAAVVGVAIGAEQRGRA